MLKEENETECVYKELVHKFLNIGDAHAKNRLSTVRTNPEIAWDININGLLCPSIECKTLYDALLTSWQLLINKRGPDYKTCLHYKTYGKRDGCERSAVVTRLVSIGHTGAVGTLIGNVGRFA